VVPFRIPAIDAGDPAITSPPPFDQRSSGFDRIREGDSDTTAVVDIGGADFLAWQRGIQG